MAIADLLIPPIYNERIMMLRNGLTQEQLGKMVGTSRQAIHAIEQKNLNHRSGLLRNCTGVWVFY